MSDHASTGRTPWMPWAACLHADPDLFFPAATGITGARQAQGAKDVRASCPVRPACLAYALATRQEHGVWGGATEKERRTMARSGHRMAASPRRDSAAADVPPAAPPACSRQRVQATAPAPRKRTESRGSDLGPWRPGPPGVTVDP